MDKDRAYQFLTGLNAKFEQMRIQILGKEEIPPPNKVISIILVEESRRRIMFKSGFTESSAMVTKAEPC